MLVSTSLAIEGPPNFAVPTSLLTEPESLTKAAPSTRQNTSALSVSTRLHWGQRFILNLQPSGPFRPRQSSSGFHNGRVLCRGRSSRSFQVTHQDNVTLLWATRECEPLAVRRPIERENAIRFEVG